MEKRKEEEKGKKLEWKNGGGFEKRREIERNES
jgi:hypothetical protein